MNRISEKIFVFIAALLFLNTLLIRFMDLDHRPIHGDEAKIFHGEVLDTKDVITLRGQSVAEIETAFRDSVDDYLEFF